MGNPNYGSAPNFPFVQNSFLKMPSEYAGKYHLVWCLPALFTHYLSLINIHGNKICAFFLGGIVIEWKQYKGGERKRWKLYITDTI